LFANKEIASLDRETHIYKLSNWRKLSQHQPLFWSTAVTSARRT